MFDSDTEYEALLADTPTETALPSQSPSGTEEIDKLFSQPPATVPSTSLPAKTATVVPTGTTAESFDYMKVVSPVVSGLLMTALVYGVARSAQVEKPKAAKTAVVIGSFTLLGQVLGNWLQSKVDDLKRQQQALTPPQAAVPASATAGW